MPLPLMEFADKIGDVMPVIAKVFARHHVSDLCKGKITLPQFLVLNFLNTDGVSKMKDLAKFMDVTTAAMTGIVDRLVRERYVERALDPEDRRIIRIKITPKGLALVKNINQHKRQMIINVFGNISQRDREEYLRIITQIRDILTDKVLTAG